MTNLYDIRPEIQDSHSMGTPALSREETLRETYKSVSKRHSLIHGKLGGQFDDNHCAIGWLSIDHSPGGLEIFKTVAAEIATVNDAGGPEESPEDRSERVMAWLEKELGIKNVQFGR